MPFTLSHAILAPPIAKLSGQRLPVAALAIGCMTPDLFRLFTNASLTISHEWSGMIVPNLLVGLFFCAVWYMLYRPFIYRWLSLHDPLNLNTLDRTCGFLIGCVVSVLIGAATHIIWDGFTHADFRTFVFQDALSREISILGYPTHVHMLMQIGTSVVTLPILIWMCLHYFKQHQQTKLVSRLIQRFCWTAFIFSMLSGLYWVMGYAEPLSLDSWKAETYDHVGKSINYFFRGFLGSMALWSIVFLAWFGFSTQPDPQS